ncbi:MAG: alpha/beta fold hydrolase [Acidimicrobiales bacterium]
MSAPVIPGAEPASFTGGPNGVLVVHGFTGNPQSMRGLAEAFAAAGYTVEMPLLPGHGTAVEDMIPTRWSDWSAAAEAAYADLAGRCERVAVAGLSMGGTLIAWLAENHPEIAAVVAINAAVEAPDPSVVEMLDEMLAEGTELMPAIGSDVAKPGVTELAYEGTPIAAARSLFDAVKDVQAKLGQISCPVLVFTSTQDHVVAPSAGDVLASSVAGPVERVTLERSFHVATLDFDAEEIERRSVEFLAKVMAG